MSFDHASRPTWLAIGWHPIMASARHTLSSGRPYWRRQRQRRQILELDDRLLHDIGITWDSARRAAGKHSWQKRRIRHRFRPSYR